MDDTAVEQWLAEDFDERWRRLADAAGSSGERESERSGSAPVAVADEEERSRPPRLAVVERDLPDGLFGFTRRDASHVVVNRRLYRVDKERTIRHEKTHHRFPRDELTIRYINGDPDVRNTLSFQGNNPGRLGGGSRGVPRTGTAAAYGAAARDGYGGERDDTAAYLR